MESEKISHRQKRLVSLQIKRIFWMNGEKRLIKEYSWYVPSRFLCYFSSHRSLHTFPFWKKITLFVRVWWGRPMLIPSFALAHRSAGDEIAGASTLLQKWASSKSVYSRSRSALPCTSPHDARSTHAETKLNPRKMPNGGFLFSTLSQPFHIPSLCHRSAYASLPCLHSQHVSLASLSVWERSITTYAKTSTEIVWQFGLLKYFN